MRRFTPILNFNYLVVQHWSIMYTSILYITDKLMKHTRFDTRVIQMHRMQGWAIFYLNEVN